MRLLEINTVSYGSSVGTYMLRCAEAARERGHEVTIATGRRDRAAGFENLRIGGFFPTLLHVAGTRFLDSHGLWSRRATLRFLADVRRLQPDVIHMHNIHGYYLHYPTLIEGLSGLGKPVFWSLHDCWPLTGHCAFPEECRAYTEGCGTCPRRSEYPGSWLRDGSARNYEEKSKIFGTAKNLTLLPVSDWMAGIVSESLLRDLPRLTVKPDIDIDFFRPTQKPSGPRVVGVAQNWERRKGLDFFVRLREVLDPTIEIRLAGRAPRHGRPEGINFIGEASSERLVDEYSRASVFVNPTHAESYCMVNREALACGAAVASRRAGAALENLEKSGVPVAGADTDEGLVQATIALLKTADSDESRSAARDHAESLYAGKPGMNRLLEVMGL